MILRRIQVEGWACFAEPPRHLELELPLQIIPALLHRMTMLCHQAISRTNGASFGFCP